MALTRTFVQTWLVDWCRAHMVQAGLSTETEDVNPDLDLILWDGLRRQGISPVDPSSIGDAHFALVLPQFYERFLVGTMIALKRRVLNFYRSQATIAVINSRVELNARANGLAADIEADELLYDSLGATAYGGGAVGRQILEHTNVPDAICLPYHL